MPDLTQMTSTTPNSTDVAMPQIVPITTNLTREDLREGSLALYMMPVPPEIYIAAPEAAGDRRDYFRSTANEFKMAFMFHWRKISGAELELPMHLRFVENERAFMVSVPVCITDAFEPTPNRAFPLHLTGGKTYTIAFTARHESTLSRIDASTDRNTMYGGFVRLPVGVIDPPEVVKDATRRNFTAISCEVVKFGEFRVHDRDGGRECYFEFDLAPGKAAEGVLLRAWCIKELYKAQYITLPSGHKLKLWFHRNLVNGLALCPCHLKDSLNAPCTFFNRATPTQTGRRQRTTARLASASMDYHSMRYIN